MVVQFQLNAFDLEQPPRLRRYGGWRDFFLTAAATPPGQEGRWLLFIHALDFDPAVFRQGNDSRDCSEHRRDDGAHNTNQQRKLRDRSSLLFDHNSANAALPDQLLEPIE